MNDDYVINEFNLLGINIFKYKRLINPQLLEGFKSFNIDYPSLIFLGRKRKFLYEDSVLGPHKDWFVFVIESLTCSLYQLFSNGCISIYFLHSSISVLTFKKHNKYSFYLEFKEELFFSDYLLNSIVKFLKQQSDSLIELSDLIDYIFDLYLGSDNKFCNPKTAEVMFVNNYLNYFSNEQEGLILNQTDRSFYPFKDYHISTSDDLFEKLMDSRKIVKSSIELLDERNMNLFNIFKSECSFFVEKTISRKSSSWDS